MPGTLRVHWTIHTSTSIPKPMLRCSRCDQQKPFEPSGKFRLNANGKRLDAWLIYRCTVCGESWNRPIFERRRKSEVDAALLDALQCNEPSLADQVARDISGLARWTQCLEDEGDSSFAIDKAVLEGSPVDADRLTVSLSMPTATTLRCDRLLAAGLGISRSRVAALAGEGRVAVDGAGRKPMARTLREGTVMTLACEGLADAPLLLRRATGLSAIGGSAD